MADFKNGGIQEKTWPIKIRFHLQIEQITKVSHANSAGPEWSSYLGMRVFPFANRVPHVASYELRPGSPCILHRIRTKREFMKNALKNALRNIPFVKYIIGTLVQHGAKKNVTFFTYDNNFKEHSDFEITKINRANTLYADRLAEIRSFFGISSLRLIGHYLLNGTPNTNFYRQRMERLFDLYGTDPDNLKKTYELASFRYVNRLMLRYHNYGIGNKVLRLSDNLFGAKPSELKILDYGCGVADPSLFLALKGASVVIVDLADLKFEFAKRRFEIRKLGFQAISADQTETPVAVDKNFNVILMAEFLEHTRSPKRFLEFALEHLKQGGLLYDSLGAVHNHGVGGQHLPEAKEEMTGKLYGEFFASNLKPVNELLGSDEFDHFYVKQ